MPPPQFFVRLQHGISGGFAPPTPSAVHTLTHSTDDPELVAVQSLVRPDGTPELQPHEPKSLRVSRTSLQPDPTLSKVDELHAILKELPTESPPGSEDIYGEDTSIMWGSDDLEWCNGGPAGCSGGKSSVQPTAEQKKKFKRAVELVKQIVAEESG